jgi:hypothetical protein
MAGPIPIVIVAVASWHLLRVAPGTPPAGRRCRGHGGQRRERHAVHAAAAWAASGLVEPRHVVVPLRRCCAPRQRVGTGTEYRPGLEDLYLPAAERRRAGTQPGSPGVRSRVGQPPGSCPGPGRARLLMLPLAGRGPTEPAWFGSVHVQLGHAVPIPRRVPGAATRHPAAGYCSRNRTRTVLGAQALQLARRCVIQGLPGSAAEFAMHHAG